MKFQPILGGVNLYTILMNKDKSLVTSINIPIYQRESKTTVIRFLVPLEIEENNLENFTCAFKYVLPDGTKGCVMPIKQDSLYNDTYLDYRLAITSRMTLKAGTIEGNLSFLKVVSNENGAKESLVIHSGNTNIVIDELKDIFIDDPNLQAIDQKLLRLESMISDVNSYQDLLNDTKADNIEIIDGEIWLTANGDKIGKPIPYNSGEAATEATVRRVLENSILSGGNADK